MTPSLLRQSSQYTQILRTHAPQPAAFSHLSLLEQSTASMKIYFTTLTPNK